MQGKNINLESKSNSAEQYGRRNNIGITGVSNSISGDNLELTVINVLSKATNVYVTADDIEACRRIGKSKENSKETIARFINRKHCKYVFI